MDLSSKYNPEDDSENYNKIEQDRKIKIQRQ